MANLNLQKMNAADALRQAVIISGKTQEQIEEEAGLRPGALDQFQSRRDPHWPNLLALPALSCALGTDLLIRWQEEQFLGKCLRYDAEINPEQLLREIVQACTELGDVASAAQKALRDDVVDRKEAMAIRREAMEVVASMYRIVNGVSGIV